MKSLRWMLLALGVATIAGCGPKGPATKTVTGTVTLDGQPVVEGDIAFIPAGGAVAGHPYGGKIADGKYSFACSTGSKRVEITSYRDVPGKFSEDNPGEKTQVREQYIPTKFNADSTLQAEVSDSGNNVFPFELKSGG